jgi:site-specific DNA-methyltransferase (adenine-specific)
MAMQQLGFRILNDIVWEKPAPPPNLGCRCFTHSTEMLLWATKAKKGSADRHKFNYEEMKAENGGRQMKNVWRFSTPSAEEKQLGKHPTQKPVALITRCLKATTDSGDLVLDPFSGSASTGVAALRLGRHFIGCEQDEKYALLGAQRLNEIAPSEVAAGATVMTSTKTRQQALFARG